MKKVIGFVISLLVCLFVLAGCSCNHVWTGPDCVTAKTCAECQATEGEPLGHTPGAWNESINLVTCSVFKEQFCTICNAPIASETVPLSTLIQDDLFIFTPNAFMERLTLIAEQHSDSFSFEFIPNGVGLQVTVDSHGKQSLIQFFHRDTTALDAGETNSTEVWCVSLIAIGESDADFRHYFIMACDPTLDKESALASDMILATAFLNAVASGDSFGYHQQNGLLYEHSYIAESALGQDYSMDMVNIYASDYR